MKSGTLTADESTVANATETAPWWRRSDLEYRNGRLHLGKWDLNQLAERVGTPAYATRAPRVLEKVEELKSALQGAGIQHKVYYAIKANRTSQLLTYLADKGLCGADVCSPEELLHAFACGFAENDISFTGTSLSRSDVSTLSKFEGLNVNLDSLSALRYFGEICPGREIGLRINPDIGIGYQGNDMLQYSGTEATKFGIYLDRLPDAIAIAKSRNLKIVRIHFHAGCGYLNQELEQFARVLGASKPFMEMLPDLREVNIGGGLGVPHRQTDSRLNLGRWANAIASAFGDSELTIAVEPGDFLVKDAGVLLTSVTYQERRKAVEFLGVDAGFNLAMEPAFYGLPCEPVATAPRSGKTQPYTIVGNVNEALDKWAVDHPMPPPCEGDFIALLNAGGYAASMRSNHCLRGNIREILLLD